MYVGEAPARRSNHQDKHAVLFSIAVERVRRCVSLTGRQPFAYSGTHQHTKFSVDNEMMAIDEQNASNMR